MGLNIDVSVPMLTVFIQGILSFFSPCILPIIPLYMGYLAGDTITDDEGNVSYNQKRVMIHTACFVVGISFAFFLLGLGVSTVGQFIATNNRVISQVGGVVILIFGLVQLGLFKKIGFTTELRLPIQLDAKNMNPLRAMVMGFTFSFAWTPCVGPALSTVLIMISGTDAMVHGILLMAIYTLGFVLPFVFLGIFTTKVLGFFKKNVNIIKYTTKIGAILMIVIGLLMVSGKMNEVSTFFAVMDRTYQGSPEESVGGSEEVDIQGANESYTNATNSDSNGDTDNGPKEVTLAPDFQLLDQYSMVHKLSDYQDKVIFLNFWATWCPPCVEEMPDIQRIYEEYGMNKEDVIILGVAMPNDNNSWTREGSVADVRAFLSENKYTYPTVMDMDGSLSGQYGINSFPTTFMIDVNGGIYGYIPGMIDYDTMVDIIVQTRNSK